MIAADTEWSATTKDVSKFVAALAPNAVMQMNGAPELKGEKSIRAFYTVVVNYVNAADDPSKK